MQAQDEAAVLEGEQEASDADNASDRLVLVDREEEQAAQPSPLASSSDAGLPGIEPATASYELERDASVETPLEQNCAEASGFDTNLRIPSHDASDAPKKASEHYRLPENEAVVQEKEAVQHDSWLSDTSLSNFTSAAETLASQAAGLFSKKAEEAKLPDQLEKHEGSAEQPSIAPETADGAATSLTRFTQAAETFATQAAGLFASKATQEKVDLASEQLQEDASLTTPDGPKEIGVKIEDSCPSTERGDGWLPDSGATFAKITHAAESLAAQTAVMFTPKAGEEPKPTDTSQSPGEDSTAGASKDSGAAVQGSSWLPEGSASLSRFTSAAETFASQAAGLFSKKAEDTKPTDTGSAGEPEAAKGSDGQLLESSSASLARFTQAAESLATQAAGLFSSKTTQAGEQPETQQGVPLEPVEDASAAAAESSGGFAENPTAEEAVGQAISQRTSDSTGRTEAPTDMADGAQLQESDLQENASVEGTGAAVADAAGDLAKPPSSWMPDGSSVAGWTNAAGAVASQAMGFFASPVTVGAHAADTQSTPGETDDVADQTTTAGSSFSKITDAAGALATQATGFFGQKKAEEDSAAAGAQGAEAQPSDGDADQTSIAGSSFSKITDAAGALATQATGFFGQKKAEEDSAHAPGRSLASDLSGAISHWAQRAEKLATHTSGLLSSKTEAQVAEAKEGEVAEAEAAADDPGEGSDSEVEAEMERRKSRLSCGLTGRCWRCGAEIVAELDAVEAHEEICSRPLQQLLDAADLLAPNSEGDVDGPEPDAGSPSHEEPQSSSQSSWTHRGVSALVDLKQSVQATSSTVARRAYEAAGYRGGSSTTLTPELDPLQVYCRIESTVEAVVMLVLDPVLKGLPSLGVPSARVEARRAVGEHGTPAAAVAALLAKVEQDDGECGMSQRVMRKVSELLVMRFLPVVGAGAFLSYTIYARLRLAAVVAEMYGHDAEDPEVQGLLFFCVLPGGRDGPSEEMEDAYTEPEKDGKGARARTPNAAVRAAKGLGHGLARQVVQRSTGWRSAADLYDLAAAICSERNGTDDQATEGPQLATARRANLLFQPCKSRETANPAFLALLGLGAAAPTLLAAAFQLLRLADLASPVLGSLAAPLLVAILLTIVVAVVLLRWQLLDFFSERPEIVTSAVFLIQALLPLFAAFAATRLVVEGALRKCIGGVGQGDDSSGGILFLLLGGWTWLRLWQRMQALEGSPAARGEATKEQRALLVVVVAVGFADFLGHEGLAWHPLPAFGALRSSHWLLGLLQAQALECQLYLLILLRNRQVLLRLLGATRMMSLCVTLFLGGVTASVGFLVSRSEFLAFVDSLAPPPRITAVLLALRRDHGACAMLLGASAGVLWQLPAGLAIVTKAGGVVLGAAAGGVFWGTYEEYREVLEEPSGGRWLLLVPETSEKAKVQALRMWSRLKLGLTEAAVERSASLVGRGMLDSLLNSLGSWWCAAGAVEIAEKVAEET